MQRPTQPWCPLTQVCISWLHRGTYLHDMSLTRSSESPTCTRRISSFIWS
jgi:hypothetical protein